jgi:hypothetical protein
VEFAMKKYEQLIGFPGPTEKEFVGDDDDV